MHVTNWCTCRMIKIGSKRNIRFARYIWKIFPSTSRVIASEKKIRTNTDKWHECLDTRRWLGNYRKNYYKKYLQITEVLKFSVAILPSVILSVFMHTFSLVPTFLWQHGLLTWPECCLIYFSVSLSSAFRTVLDNAVIALLFSGAQCKLHRHQGRSYRLPCRNAT